MDKENGPTTPRLASRKSYSILSPISNNIGSPSKDRKISESTGLAKFSLSPKRQLQTPTSIYSGGVQTPTSNPRDEIVKRELRGLPVYIPIQHEQKKKSTTQEPQISSLDLQSELLEKYAAKHAELNRHEKEVERLKFELLQISTSLENCKRLQKLEALKTSNEPVLYDIFKQVHHQTNQEIERLTNPQKSDDILPSINNLKTRASKIFTNDNNIENLRKKASSMFTIEKSGTRSRNDSEITDFLAQSNERFDVLSKKTSRFFTDVMTNLSPKKISQTTDDVFTNFASNIKKLNVSEPRDDPANNSFNFDYLSAKQGLEDPHILFESSFIDDSESNMNVIHEQAEDTSDVVDIDDYDSSFDN